MHKLIFVLGLWMVVSPDVWENPKVYNSREFVLSFGLELGKTGVIAEDTVETGILIISGKCMKPPYVILLRNDTLFINDIAICGWDPYEAERDKEFREKEDEEYRRKYEGTLRWDKRRFERKLKEKYYEYVKKGLKGKELIKELEKFIKTQKIVKLRKWKVREAQVTIVYDFKWKEYLPEKELDPDFGNEYVNNCIIFKPWWTIPLTKEDTVFKERAKAIQFYAVTREALKSDEVLWMEFFTSITPFHILKSFVIYRGPKNTIHKLKEIIFAQESLEKKIEKWFHELPWGPGSTLVAKKAIEHAIKNQESWEGIR